MIDRHIRPELGHKRAIEVSRADVARLHLAMKETPYRANRMLAVLGSLYTFGQRRGLIPDEVNPSRKIEKYREHKRERYLSMVELDRLGAAIASAEADGVISKYAATAIRLLLFTGARLGEILNLKWEHVDFERALLHLPDSKTGRKTIVLNNAAMAILEHASRQEGNPYVIVGQKPEVPITHMKKPWKILVKRAGLEKARLHDLRHTFAK